MPAKINVNSTTTSMQIRCNNFLIRKLVNLYKYSRIETISNLVPTVLVSVKHEMNSIKSMLNAHSM